MSHHQSQNYSDTLWSNTHGRIGAISAKVTILKHLRAMSLVTTVCATAGCGNWELSQAQHIATVTVWMEGLNVWATLFQKLLLLVYDTDVSDT